MSETNEYFMSGSDEIVSLLLQNGANPDIAGTTGNTPLIEAARYGNFES